jgi:putative nucleotidyltransferase with HDIG domain
MGSMTQKHNISTDPWPYTRLSKDKIELFPKLSSAFEQVRRSKRFSPLFTLIEKNSPPTVKHSKGVAAVAQMLGKQVGCSETETGQLSLAGMLHDIGKILIPDHIINKAGTLSREEALVMKSHVVKTVEILSSASVPSQVLKWCAYHHERLNGRGYPYGLNATALDQGCRIMSLADVFVALTEDRIYRDGMDPLDAIEVIELLVDRGSLDETLFSVLRKNPILYNDTRLLAQLPSPNRSEAA